MTPSAPLHALPESYVVRIYRRDPRWPMRAAGTFELVGRGTEFGFKNLRELQRILATLPALRPVPST